jgi:hypothetical protein
MKKKHPKPGRPRIGQTFSVTVTDEQLAWLDAKASDGTPRAEIVRQLIAAAMCGEGIKP